MRRFCLGFVLALVATPALASGKPKSISWGKAGVSLADYRADSLACANRAYGVPVTIQPRTLAALLHIQSAEMYAFLTSRYFYKPGAGFAEMLPAVLPQNAMLRTSRYYETFRHATYYDVIEQLQRVVDACLVERGYQRFRLTDDQRRDLDRLEKGSAERERYLHRLGSDAGVLEAQRA